ncbi:MAG TPA: PAS domain-containing protein [Stellaceae bacterium]|nr:PAS domain-containing protein [Stellaceae bacterium]
MRPPVDAVTILESITDAFYAVDHDWRLVYVNPRAEELWRRPSGQLIGKNLWEEFPAYVGTPGHAAMLKAARDRQSVHFEAASPVLGGWIAASIYPTKTGLSVYFRDVTQRKETDAALLAAMRRAEAAEKEAREARLRLEDAVETMSEGFVLFDAEDRLVMCNARYKQIYPESIDFIVPGARFEDMLRGGLSRGQYVEAVGREEEWIAERLAAHRAVRGGFEQHLPNDRWVRIVERRTAAGGIVGIRIDVTELKRREQELARLNAELETRVNERTRSLAAANEKLRRSEERYSALFEHSPTIIYLLKRGPDRRFTIDDVNPACLKLSGYRADEIVGKPLEAVFPPEAAALAEARCEECASTGRAVEYESAYEMPLGPVARHTFLVPLFTPDGRVARIFATSIDVTEARRLEQQLREAQKMQAVGQLAGGVAHDFNNLLTAVLGNIELVLGQETDRRKTRLLRGALRAAERGADLTRQLLAFSRRQRLKAESVDLNERIRSMLELLRRTLGPAIRIEQALEPELWRARTDATQLELAVLNLAINARDAMPEGGALTIETRNLAAADPHRPPELPAGDYVMIAVIDTGSGMSEEVRSKAFEPFFTTKEVGKGSGLGLAQVYGFAEQSGGKAQIASRPRRGTRVTIFLPRALDAAAPEGAARAAAPSGGSGSILLVDDEPEVREFAATALRELGYTVCEAEGGEAALAIIDRDVELDLLVLDYAMPGMNGIELLEAARRRRPGLPLVLITGYADTGALESLRPGDVVLRKPFKQSELAREVGIALAGRRLAG